LQLEVIDKLGLCVLGLVESLACKHSEWCWFDGSDHVNIEFALNNNNSYYYNLTYVHRPFLPMWCLPVLLLWC